MTSRDPIIISDSESEPEEASYEGTAVTVSSSSSERPRSSSSSPERSRSSSSSSDEGSRHTIVSETPPTLSPESLPTATHAPLSDTPDPLHTTAHESLLVTPETLPDTPDPLPVTHEPLPTVTPEPVTTTATQPRPRPNFEVGEPSRPTKIRKTARKTVGRFPTRQLAPRDDSSDDAIDIPCDVDRTRLPGPEPLPWMTTILPRWRELENLPSTYVAHAPITGEPIEVTVPTLVGVCRTILHFLRLRHIQILALQHDTSHLEGDIQSVYERVDVVEARQEEDSETVRARMETIEARHEEHSEATNARMEAIEARQRRTNLAMGVMVGLYIVSLVAGSFFPFWH